MIKYASIESLYVRNKATNRLTAEIRDMTWLSIHDWVLTEKVDGTNIRILLGMDEEGNKTFEVRGRTDKANLPGDLEANIIKQFAAVDAHEYFGIRPETPRSVTLYGEGYGAGIQKNGGLYREDKGFILFDVRYGNEEKGYYEDFLELPLIALTLGVNVVPVVGMIPSVYDAPYTVTEMDQYFPTGSLVARETRQSEGVVARPIRELRDKFGNRIMWKLTYRDLPVEGYDAGR